MICPSLINEGEIQEVRPHINEIYIISAVLLWKGVPAGIEYRCISGIIAVYYRVAKCRMQPGEGIKSLDLRMRFSCC